MKRLVAALASLLLMTQCVEPAFGQANPGNSVGLWGTDTGTGALCVVGVTPTCKVPIAGTFSATVTFQTFGAANPGSGLAVGFQGASTLTAVDATHGLPVNCIVGCAGGTSSNASSGVATSSTNGQSIVWNFGFNGTTWDQLQVDSLKNLKAVTPSPVGAAGFATGQVSCASTATLIAAARPGAPGTGRTLLVIKQVGTTPIQVETGASGVTTSTGMVMDAIAGASQNWASTAAWYCIVATGTQTISFTEFF